MVKLSNEYTRQSYTSPHAQTSPTIPIHSDHQPWLTVVGAHSHELCGSNIGFCPSRSRKVWRNPRASPTSLVLNRVVILSKGSKKEWRDGKTKTQKDLINLFNTLVLIGYFCEQSNNAWSLEGSLKQFLNMDCSEVYSELLGFAI